MSKSGLAHCFGFAFVDDFVYGFDLMGSGQVRSRPKTGVFWAPNFGSFLEGISQAISGKSRERFRILSNWFYVGL